MLFTIVLGVAALAATINPRQAGPPRDDPKTSEATGRRASPPVAETFRLRFDARSPPSTRTVSRGAHVVLRVIVPEPGQVTIDGLGQALPADRDTPALFDLLPSRAGRFEVALVGADDGRERTVGTLAVR